MAHDGPNKIRKVEVLGGQTAESPWPAAFFV